MKAKFVSIFMCSIVPMFLSATQASVNEDKVPYDLHDEHDKTDIFALQLDSSEEEEQDEEDDDELEDF